MFFSLRKRKCVWCLVPLVCRQLSSLPSCKAQNINEWLNVESAPSTQSSPPWVWTRPSVWPCALLPTSDGTLSAPPAGHLHMKIFTFFFIDIFKTMQPFKTTEKSNITHEHASVARRQAVLEAEGSRSLFYLRHLLHLVLLVFWSWLHGNSHNSRNLMAAR